MKRRNTDTGASLLTLHWPELALLLWLLLAAAAGTASAQSADPKSPTPLTADEISGGEVEERASYYFTFEAGPGEVTAALEAKMKNGSKGAAVGVELLDAGAKSLAGALVSGGLDAGKERVENELFKQLGKLTSAADSLGGGDTKRKTARVKVKTRQPLVLRLTVDKGVESFTVRVGGAVEFAPYGGDAYGAAPTGQTTTGGQAQPPPDPDAAAPAQGEAQPTSGRPAGLLPGLRPALVKVPAPRPASSQSPTKPALVKVPGKQPQTPAPQQQSQPGEKPPAVKIPGKKQS